MSDIARRDPSGLGALLQAREAIAKAKTVHEAANIRDVAEAARAFAKARGYSLEAINDWAEVKVRSERKAGEILAAMEKQEGGRPNKKTGNVVLPVPPKLEDIGVTKMDSSRWQKMAKIPEAKFENKIVEMRSALEEITTAAVMREGAHVGKNTGENEWYTPAEIIELAREVMGRIDLDPASHEDAQKIVKAKAFYTKENNGLDLTWFGKVWMNPPYAQPLIGRFCEKLTFAHISNEIEEAICLTNNATETEWGQNLIKCSMAVCFPDGRVRFWNKTESAAPLQGQMLCYLGTNVERFREIFRPLGVVLS